MVTLAVDLSALAFGPLDPMSTPFSLFTTPKAVEARSSVFHLKNRLAWGEPALTILDVRERADFHQGHIQGAISIPLAELATISLLSLEYERDIYVYGETNEQSAEAANQLRSAGYCHVAELDGGLVAWKVAGGAIAGRAKVD